MANLVRIMHFPWSWSITFISEKLPRYGGLPKGGLKASSPTYIRIGLLVEQVCWALKKHPSWGGSGQASSWSEKGGSNRSANRQWIRRWQVEGRGRRTKGWRSTELHWARWIGDRLSFLTPREGSTAALIFTDWCRKNYPISWHPPHRTLVPFPSQGAATHHRAPVAFPPSSRPAFRPLIPRRSAWNKLSAA